MERQGIIARLNLAKRLIAAVVEPELIRQRTVGMVVGHEISLEQGRSMARAIRAHRLMIAAQEHHAGLPLMRHDPLHHRGILMAAVRVIPQEDDLILIRPELHSVPNLQETVEHAMDIPHGQ